MLTDYRILILFFIPIIENAVFFYMTSSRRNPGFNIIEAVISLAIFIVAMLGLWTVGRDMRINNFTEQIGGFIIGKEFKDGEHEESYQTCTGEGDNEVCVTHEYTVYHREYIVYNNTGDWWDGNKWYERVNTSCKGCEPDRVPLYYAEAYVGKPVSLDHSYPNYIAAVNESYYKNVYSGLVEIIPDICGPTPDYRVSPTSVIKAVPLGFDQASPLRGQVYGWNFFSGDPTIYTSASYDPTSIPMYMDTIFGLLGTEVQSDIHLYVVNSQNRQYADLCLAKWKNGAKNSVYVFIFGQSDGVSFTATDVYVGVGVDGSKNKNTGLQSQNEGDRSNEYMKFDIRDKLMDYFSKGGSLDREQVLRIIFDNVRASFVRQEMADFKSQKQYVHPTGTWIIIMSILLAILDAGVHFYFSENEY